MDNVFVLKGKTRIKITYFDNSVDYIEIKHDCTNEQIGDKLQDAWNVSKHIDIYNENLEYGHERVF